MPDYLDITTPQGKSYKMPWAEKRDPTEAEIDSFIKSQESFKESSSPFVKEVKSAAISGKPISLGSMFTSLLPEHNRNYTPETLPSFPVRAAKEILYEGMIRPALSPAGIATSLMGTGGALFPKTRAIGVALAKRYTPNFARALGMDMGEELATPATKTIANEVVSNPNLPHEFTPVGAEPPYKPPQFNNPEDAVYQKVLENKGRAPLTVEPVKLLNTTEVKNAEVVKQTIEAKPKYKLVNGYREVDLVNPNEDTINAALKGGYQAKGLNPDGSLRLELKPVNPVVGPSAKPVTVVSQAAKAEPKLPRDLAGAQPRFYFGKNGYIPQFQSDVDKAAFILAQASPSKRNADYLAFVMEHTGLDANDSIAYGRMVRERVKDLLKGQPEGSVPIPRIGHEIEPISPPASQAGIPKFDKAARQSSVPVQSVQPVQSTTPLPTTPVEPVAPAGPPKPPYINVGKIALEEPPPAPKPPKPDTLLTKAIRVGGLSKSLMSGVDISAPRQGFPLIGTKEFWKATAPMVRSFASEEGYNAAQQRIASKPTFDLAQKAGVSFTDLGTELGKREEHIMSDLPEKLRIPFTDIKPYRASNRAYTAFLNTLRSDRFDKLAEYSQNMGVDISKPENLKDVANFINHATGRGNLGQLEPAANLLNATFFSPRLMKSRLHFFNPMNYAQANPVVRKEMWKSLLSMGAFVSSTGELAHLAGAKVSLDPTNSDFGKIRVGNTRVDLSGGFLPYIVLAERLRQGKITSSTTGVSHPLNTGKYGAPTKLDAVTGFLGNKESPLGSFISGWLKGKDFDGKTDFNVPKAVIERITPMAIQDLYDIAKENPELLPLGALGLVGGGVQTYDKKPVKRSPYSVERIH